MDPLPLIGLVAALSLLALLWVRGKPDPDTRSLRPGLRAARGPGHAAHARTWPSTQEAASAPALAAVPETLPDPPASLREFQWHALESLPEARRDWILAELKHTPPPPRAFHQLVSPDFVASASSAELAELVIGVPLAATQVLARVNSAFYGLQRPVGSLGHAITYLGLNTVRGICLQYMLEASFSAGAAGMKQRFDQLWAASAIGTEIGQKLAQGLRLPDAGGLVTEIALSSLGHFSAAILMPREGTSASNQSLLARTWAEQMQLGAPAAEIGALLMRAWALPEALVEDVRAVDRMLVTPAGQLEPQRRLRLAVAYLSVRLGERLARGDAVKLGDLDASVLAGDDYFHLRASLQADQRQALQEALRAPDLARSVQHMLATLRDPPVNEGTTTVR